VNRREDIEIVKWPDGDCSTSDVERARLGSMIASWGWNRKLRREGERIVTVPIDNERGDGMIYEL